ncbi:sugar ABC transporter permease [Reinekea marina]|uniref:Carbohydrate ABC transporter permease n=1 Tax=Reinekea marina TaxID=1310421 RepID=A0ABV7WQU8_9GAMM|nr:sugar ABC transporter permease [Reinekea marina]MDN3647846.1 sugar ABC transporter permease [Reinekea marina]
MTKVNNNLAWLLVLPALLLLALVVLIPLTMVFNFSFHDIFTQDFKTWVGAQWYRDILGSSHFYASLGRSLLYSLLVLIIEIPLGILLALSLPRRNAFVALFLVILSLPLLVPWNIIPMLWHVLISSDSFVAVFAAFGVDLDWKFNPIHTWIVLILMDVWHWTSLVLLLCYAGLSTIPKEYYQAAAIDKASRWTVFKVVEFPRIIGVLLMALLLRFMDSFMSYTEAFSLNAGGPKNATMFLAMDLAESIKAFDYGPASARSMIYFIIILTVVWFFKVAQKKYEH